MYVILTNSQNIIDEKIKYLGYFPIKQPCKVTVSTNIRRRSFKVTFGDTNNNAVYFERGCVW